MKWTPRQAALLASPACPACQGLGAPTADPALLCRCVYRAVFRSCYAKFRRCATADAFGRRVSYDPNPRGVDRHMSWARRNEDYCADFHAAGRRVLPYHLYRIFAYFHLHGASLELVCKRLRIERRAVLYAITDIEVAVGRELAHMRPYSLYPPRDYMQIVISGERSTHAS